MRLIEKSLADKLPATIKHGEEFEAPKTFYLENAKGNTIPKHFKSEENKDKAEITILGQKTTVYRNVERSEYCAFELTGEDGTVQAHYIRDHSFIEGKNYVEYKKPTKEAPPKKERKAKEDEIVPVAKKNYEVTDVKSGESVTMTGKDFIKKFGLEKATKILNGRTPKTFTADEYAGEVQEAEAAVAGDTGAA